MTKESVKNFVIKVPPQKPAPVDKRKESTKSLSATKKLQEADRQMMVRMMPQEMLRPEMITLRRKKKKVNSDEETEYEDIPEEEHKNVPTLQQMQCEEYWRAMQKEAEQENKHRAKFMNSYKWDIDRFEFFEK